MWDEAWQRVTIYGMTDRFERVLHLDVDMIAFNNFEHILEDGQIPSVARRMAACMTLGEVCIRQPVSNFMLVKTDAEIANKISDYLDERNRAGLGPDETVQFEIA